MGALVGLFVTGAFVGFLERGALVCLVDGKEVGALVGATVGKPG